MSNILNCEQLFLLEIVVEELVVENFDDPTTLHTELKFSGLPCFQVSQKPGEGKSCLFCMDALTLAETMQGEPLVFSVWWAPIETLEPNVIAQAWVPFPETMIDMVRNAADMTPENPIEENIQSIYPLRNRARELIGEACLIIRLTCYGRTILTGFYLTPTAKFKFETTEKEKEPACEVCPSLRKFEKPSSPPKVDQACETDDIIDETSINDDRIRASSQKKESVVCKDKGKLTPTSRHSCHCGDVKEHAGSPELRRPKKRKSLFVKGHSGFEYPTHNCSKYERKGIPANHGWAWNPFISIRPHSKYVRKWCPGKISPLVLSRIEESRALRCLPPLGDTYCNSSNDLIRVQANRSKKPTLHIHSLPRSNQIAFWPNEKTKEPLKWSIIRNGDLDDSELCDSEFELEFDVPPSPVIVKAHKKTQYHEEDCPKPPAPPPSPKPEPPKKNKFFAPRTKRLHN